MSFLPDRLSLDWPFYDCAENIPRQSHPTRSYLTHGWGVSHHTTAVYLGRAREGIFLSRWAISHCRPPARVLPAVFGFSLVTVFPYRAKDFPTLPLAGRVHACLLSLVSKIYVCGWWYGVRDRAWSRP